MNKKANLKWKPRRINPKSFTGTKFWILIPFYFKHVSFSSSLTRSDTYFVNYWDSLAHKDLIGNNIQAETIQTTINCKKHHNQRFEARHSPKTKTTVGFFTATLPLTSCSCIKLSCDNIKSQNKKYSKTEKILS